MVSERKARKPAMEANCTVSENKPEAEERRRVNAVGVATEKQTRKYKIKVIRKSIPETYECLSGVDFWRKDKPYFNQTKTT